MSTVMILGAGVPRAAQQKNTVGKRPPLDKDFFEIARLGKYSEYRSVVEYLEKLFGEYSTTLTQSLETAATYLYLKAVDSKSNSVHHTAFLNFLFLFRICFYI